MTSEDIIDDDHHHTRHAKPSLCSQKKTVNPNTLHVTAAVGGFRLFYPIPAIPLRALLTPFANPTTPQWQGVR